MRRTLISVAGAGLAYLLGHCAGAAEVPQALSSTGPAVIGFNNQLIVAWTGDSATGPHKVWYSSFSDVWSPQASVPGSSTNVAPALATADQELFLATTGTDEKIYYYVSQSGTFDDNETALCDATTCAQTLAAPALAGSAASLFAAWTTPTGAIRYAQLENGAWTIGAPLPYTNAITNASTAPTMAVYLDRLFIAWVSPEDNAIYVASTALPLNDASWSEAPTKISAKTSVAPALAVLTTNDVDAGASQLLYVSWTNPESALKFERLEALFGQWVPVDPPVPLPTGTQTPFTPALTTCVLAKSVTSATVPESEPAVQFHTYNIVGLTLSDAMVDIFCGQHTGPTK